MWVIKRLKHILKTLVEQNFKILEFLRFSCVLKILDDCVPQRYSFSLYFVHRYFLHKLTVYRNFHT